MMVATRVEATDIAYAVDDTIPKLELLLLDANGEAVIDATGVTLVCRPSDAAAEDIPVAGTGVSEEPGKYEFNPSALTTGEELYRTDVAVTYASGQNMLGGPMVLVLDPSALWTTPAAVAQLAPGFTNSDLLLSIYQAEEAVRAWVVTPVLSPVSERVRLAVTLLAARALTSPPDLGGPPILAETMGDYEVRFASPGAYAGALISGDIAELLAPWGPRKAFSVGVGPDSIVTDVVGLPEVIFVGSYD